MRVITHAGCWDGAVCRLGSPNVGSAKRTKIYEDDGGERVHLGKIKTDSTGFEKNHCKQGVPHFDSLIDSILAFFSALNTN